MMVDKTFGVLRLRNERDRSIDHLDVPGLAIKYRYLPSVLYIYIRYSPHYWPASSEVTSKARQGTLVRSLTDVACMAGAPGPASREPKELPMPLPIASVLNENTRAAS